jgi:hypothetical protein
LQITGHMGKSARDEIGAREDWIQERLGERKYRQLRMHLNGALRLLNELAAIEAPDSTRTDETTKAVADLSHRLQQLSPKRSIRMQSLKPSRRDGRKVR